MSEKIKSAVRCYLELSIFEILCGLGILLLIAIFIGFVYLLISFCITYIPDHPHLSSFKQAPNFFPGLSLIIYCGGIFYIIKKVNIIENKLKRIDTSNQKEK